MDSSNDETIDNDSIESVQNKYKSLPLLSINSFLYNHIIALSNYIRKNQIKNRLSLTAENCKNIYQLISDVVNDLSLIDMFSKIEIGPESTINEVYQLLSYVLYTIFQQNSDVNRDLYDENQTLKKELLNIKKNYSQLIQNTSTLQKYNFSKHNNQYETENIQIGKFNEIQKYKEMEREVTNLIIYLRNHFNLSESTNLYNIIDAINIKCTCAISEKDRIEQLMMQNQDLEDRLLSLQKEKYDIEKKLFEQKSIGQNEINSQIFILENEISSLKIQLKNITEKCETRKSKVQSLTKTINEQNDQIKQLERELETSKIMYDKLLLDAEDKKKHIDDDNQIIISKNDLQIKDNEINNLNSALNELSAQLEKMNDDLMSETRMKTHLFNALQVQNEIMNNVEKLLKTQIEQSHSKIEIRSPINFNDEIEEEEEENDTSSNENLTNDLLLFISKTDLEKAEIDKISKIIQNDDLTFSMKFVSTINTIINAYKQQTIETAKSEPENDDEDSLKSQNSRLKRYLANLLYFIEKVASSGEIQNFFIESETNHDFREKLVTQCSRIESFLKENGIDLDEENFILENSDVTDILFDISNFSSDVEEQVYNPDAQELLLLLRQFAFINDAIRRFADEMKTQAEKFLSEIKQMRYQISENEEQHADELARTTEALQNEMQKRKSLCNTIGQIQCILREAAVSEENDQKQQKSKVSQKTKRIIDNSEEVEFEEEEEEKDDAENSEGSEKVENNEFYILKCLQIIQKGIQLESGSLIEYDYSSNSSQNLNQNLYIKKIESKLNSEIEKRKNIESKAREEIARLRSKVKQLKKQLSSDKKKFLTEIDYAQKQIDELSASFIETNDSSMKSKNEIDEKNSIISALNDKIQNQSDEIEKLKSLFDLEKEKIIENYQSQNEKIFKEKDDKINSLLSTIESSQNISQEKVKEVKQDYKQTIKKLQNDLALETQRGNTIRDHYENLLNEIKIKLNQSRNSEKVANEKAACMENELKNAKSTISKLKIDLKMLNLKIVAADDKLIREKSLFDSQMRMKVLSLQTEHQDQMNDLKEKYENDIHKIYMKICEIFKDFIDFNMTFSEESVMNILQQVSNSLYQANQKLLKKKSVISILGEVKSLLNVSNDKDVIGALTSIIGHSNEYKEKKLIIENNQKRTNSLLKKVKAINNMDNLSREWEVWAKRLYSLITENFSTAKTPKQLQYAIEEALLSSIGQRQLWKKLEILRKEKSILHSWLISMHPLKPKKSLNSKNDENEVSYQSLISLIAAYISIYRMQKLAGHLKFNIDFSPKKENC